MAARTTDHNGNVLVVKREEKQLPKIIMSSVKIKKGETRSMYKATEPDFESTEDDSLLKTNKSQSFLQTRDLEIFN